MKPQSSINTKKNKNTLIKILYSLVIILVVSTSVKAATTYTWKNTATATYATSGNWSPAGPAAARWSGMPTDGVAPHLGSLHWSSKAHRRAADRQLTRAAPSSPVRLA